MADVSFFRRTGPDRGQLILVGGIVVALALVALVFLLNATMFAENVATRGIDPGADRAYDHADFVEHAGLAVVTSENDPTANHVEWFAVGKNVSNDVTAIDAAAGRYSFRRFGAYASVSNDTIRRGAALIQDQTGDFKSSSSPQKTDWTLATTNGIRNFSTTVEASNTGNPANDTDAYTLRIEGDGTDGGEWFAHVKATSSEVTVNTSTNSPCSITADTAKINWTEGSMGGCTFEFAQTSGGGELTKPYTITFENGDKATGTYRLVVSNTTGDSVETSNFDPPSTSSPSSSPWQYPAVYHLVMTLTYEDSGTRYESGVRIAPNEPSETGVS